ncbi:MAG: dihydrolipoyllysine-residue succinyltransferase [Rubritalea sp.]|uniref:dihydrolipoyllysine-residue succinyltransferase n=1 Tax=Rubritalea sp. TaxID=2109375 RepID=UPI0032426DB7
MSFEVIIPNAGESVTSANVAQWHVEDGASVSKGDILLTIETDKVSSELESEQSGIIQIITPEGEEVAIGTVVAKIDAAGAVTPAAATPAPAVVEAAPVAAAPASAGGEVIEVLVPAAGESVTSANVANWQVSTGDIVNKGDVLVTLETDKVSTELEAEVSGVIEVITPEGEEVDIGTLIAKITVGATAPAATPVAAPAPVAKAASAPVVAPTKAAAAPLVKPTLSTPAGSGEKAGAPVTEGRTTRKKMSMLRRKIATHLVNAQQTAAILSTFNEVDMSAIMKLRKEVQEDFVKKHGCKLGFMSIFVKAVAQALKDVPSINGRIEGNDIIQNNFIDIGCAIGTEKGLVVPVLRDCDKKGFATIEKDILDYANKAREGKIEMSDLQGGGFTISNGGVYGSLLSTPILNAPQSGILGMHTIQQRPVAVDGKVEIRPMMYLALSYDHRLVDGKEAVTFLIRIKECLENPTRMMLEM